jgi:hypothetical protein
MVDERRHALTQLRRVLAAQVDLVLRAVDPEPHRLVRRAAVKIVHKRDNCLSCHPKPPRDQMGHLLCSVS